MYAYPFILPNSTTIFSDTYLASFNKAYGTHSRLHSYSKLMSCCPFQLDLVGNEPDSSRGFNPVFNAKITSIIMMMKVMQTFISKPRNDEKKM